MTTRFHGAVAGPSVMLAAVMALIAQTPASSQVPSSNAGPARNVSRERAIVDQYCVTCHNARLKTANLDLSAIDLAAIASHAEIGEKIVRKLRAGMMPPPDLPRPDAASRNFLASSLEAQLDRAAAAQPTLT